ncbi:hypothetical protein NDA13_004946 [Ustilago tritici]|nr:hypothetical protein NDA13_004946 [Ustilago tritici]
MLVFSIQGRRNNNLVLLHSLADFHMLSNFSPGILLGLDVIHSTGMVIDICSSRVQVQDISFPIYNTRGKTMSTKNVSQALVIQNTSTILPHSCSFVHIHHNLLQNVQYTVDSSLWTSPNDSGPLAVPSAILDHNNMGLWVANYGSTPVDIQSNTQLAKATPLAPDNIAVSAGLFCFDEVTANPAKAVEWDSLVSDTVLTGETALNCIFTSTSSQTETTNDTRPLNFSDNPLAKPPEPIDLETILVDNVFQVRRDTQGQPHPSIVTILRISDITMRLKLAHLDALRPKAPRRVSPNKCQVIDNTLDQLLSWNVIKPSNSPMSYPDLYHMVGLFNYYHNFIPNYAGLATPLTNLLQGHKYQCSTKGMWQLVDADRKTTRAVDIKIDLGTAQDKALAKLKAALSSPPTLGYPDFNRSFLLYIDASQQVFAAALHQRLPLSDSDSTKNKSAAASPAEANDLDIPPMPTHQQKSDGLLKSIVDAIGAGYTRVGYKIQDGTLVYLGPQHTVHHLCVPVSDLPTVFHKAHDLGSHLGCAKTTLHLESLHHPHLSSALQAYIDNYCKGLDTALVIMDMFLKLMLTAPCSSCITSTQLFNLLANLILRKGWKPKVIITDSDKHFIGTTGQEHVLHTFSMESAKDWVDILPAAELAINSTPLLTTEQTPFDLVYIVQPDPLLLPSVSNVNMEDCLTIAKARLDFAWQTTLRHLEENKSQYNMKHKPLHVLSIGDRVFIHTQDRPIPGTQRHAKLDPGKVCPFPVKQVLLRHCFKLDLPPNLYSDNLFNILQLEPAPKEHDPFNCSLDAPVTTYGQDVMRFEVEAIVGQRPFRNYVQYCVKWCGDPHTTWEFKEDLLEDGCEAVIQDWNGKHTSSPAAIAHMLNSSLYKRLIAFISTTTSPADAKLLGLELEISCLA